MCIFIGDRVLRDPEYKQLPLISFHFIKCLSISGATVRPVATQITGYMRFLSRAASGNHPLEMEWKSLPVKTTKKNKQNEKWKSSTVLVVGRRAMSFVRFVCVACVKSICVLIHVSNHLAFLCERLKHRSSQLRTLRSTCHPTRSTVYVASYFFPPDSSFFYCLLAHNLRISVFQVGQVRSLMGESTKLSIQLSWNFLGLLRLMTMADSAFAKNKPYTYSVVCPKWPKHMNYGQP